MTTGLPAELSALNIRAWLTNAMGLCGCADIESVAKELIELLEWHWSRADRPGFETLFAGRKGVFYLLSALIDRLGLSEHGTSIRNPWLTDEGVRLLNGLRAVTAPKIDSARGEAYDGTWYR